MSKIKLYCVNCGYEIIINENDIAEEKCPLCHHILELDENSLDELVIHDIEQGQLETMKQNLLERGNDNVWYAIENNINNPYFRIELRKHFFICGGKVPKKEMII